MMQYFDPATSKTTVPVAAGTVGNFVCGPVCGGAASGAINGFLSGGNIGRSALGGAAAGAVTLGMGRFGNPLLTNAMSGAVNAAVSGGDPAKGAWMGAAMTAGISVISYGVLSSTVPAYAGGAPANSVGYALPDTGHGLVGFIKGMGLALLDGGPFTHSVAVNQRGALMGATPNQGPVGVINQSIVGPDSLQGRHIFFVPGVLSNGAVEAAMAVNQGVSYNAFNFGGVNCACFTSQALGYSGISANGRSPNGQFYELMRNGITGAP